MKVDNAHLLVVDDVVEARYAKVRALQKAGWSVSETSDGKETLAFVASRPTDLVVLDTMLPDILGTEVCREIKRTRPDIMVLQTSATFIGPDAKVTALDAGADAYLVEPAEAPVLVATVMALLRAKSAEDQLRVANERLLARTLELEALLCSAPIGLAFFDKIGGCPRINDEFAAINALAAKGKIRRTVAEISDTASSFEETVIEVFSTGTALRNVELSEGSGAASRHWLTGFFPVRDASNGITAVGCWAIDISDRKRAEEHKELLIHELDHRVKNTLTIVQSIASQTFKGAQVGQIKVDDFSSRLCALSDAHDVLTRGHWIAADLRELVVNAAQLHGAAGRFSVEGPNLKLKPKAALALAMGLHELSTNAVKYGALSNKEGQVNVCWSIDPTADLPLLHLRWKEKGGPSVAPPMHRGFGSKLLEKLLASDLQGTISLDFAPDGVTCAVSAPIAICEGDYN
ncbi:response regulator [Methylocystis sp. H62]|uniref:HWE histidine kinase domain-containing protein n=1 Tax=Methylocystis sp. H62 TaxID=2785789 RepID=UPI0018C2EEA0|nr:HWE histidine kinase domain-containing protein [Methylocystis sp. H62]MBG0792052.1 response regulator [Methylocystis sp. H62]